MNSTLTPTEKIIAGRLRKVRGTGISNEMFNMVFAGNKPTEIRQLLFDIRHQAFDAPEETMKLVGFKTYLMIINL